MNVVLCGMMGVGKTSVGKKLEFLSKRKCVDTDEIIEEKYGKITDIFEQKGEPYFRDLETEVAKMLGKKDNLIVSTGGGLVMRSENVAYLKENGKIFFLRAKIETLLERVAGNNARPLLKDGAEKKLKELIPVRTPVYEGAADHIIDTDGRTVADVAAEILLYMGE